MTFRVRGLAPLSFDPLFALSDAELEAQGARRTIVTAKPGAPCRVSLADAEIGEQVILLNYLHQPAETPYQQQGPIYVREGCAAFDDTQIAPALRVRPLSLRGFDEAGMMLDADIVDGAEAESLIARLFDNPSIAYIHAHYAKRGCYAARIERA